MTAKPKSDVGGCLANTMLVVIIGVVAIALLGSFLGERNDGVSSTVTAPPRSASVDLPADPRVARANDLIRGTGADWQRASRDDRVQTAALMAVRTAQSRGWPDRRGRAAAGYLLGCIDAASAGALQGEVTAQMEVAELGAFCLISFEAENP